MVASNEKNGKKMVWVPSLQSIPGYSDLVWILRATPQPADPHKHRSGLWGRELCAHQDAAPKHPPMLTWYSFGEGVLACPLS